MNIGESGLSKGEGQKKVIEMRWQVSQHKERAKSMIVDNIENSLWTTDVFQQQNIFDKEL